MREFSLYFVDFGFEEGDFGWVSGELFADFSESFDGFCEEAFVDFLIDFEGGSGAFSVFFEFGFEEIPGFDGAVVGFLFELELAVFGALFEIETCEDADGCDNCDDDEADDQVERVPFFVLYIDVLES